MGDTVKIVKRIPDEVFDLIIIDPPYNLAKNFNGLKFKSMNGDMYMKFIQKWFMETVRTLKTNGSLYLCGDWKNTAILQKVMNDFLFVKIE